MSFRLSSRVALSALAGIAVAACASGGSSSSSASPAAASSAPAAAMAAPAKSAMPAGVTTAMIAVGDSIYHKSSCQRCHGMDAKGTPRAPDLTDATWSQIDGSYAQIIQVITTGVPKEKIKMAGASFAMNPRGGTNLSDEQIAQLASYVYSLSHK